MWTLLTGIGIGIVLFVIAANFVRNERKVARPVVSPYGIDDPQFPRAVGSLLGPPLLPGNAVAELLNGDTIFPSMLGAIHNARATITFETYIYWSGDIGHTFAHALAERARTGVKVLILLDWAGSVPMNRDLLDLLESAGCQVIRYHAPRWYHLTRINNRTHRKVLIIDGHTGFTGGVGIADKWTGRAQDPHHWRDTHFKVEGPVVAQMQAVFMANWIKARRAGRSRWGRLLEAGVRIYEYTPTTIHTKIMIVDGLWSSVGSTNFDNRSFRLNDEANLNVYDSAFAQQLTRTFEADKRHTREITLEAWRSRPLQTKLADRFWSLFRQQM